MKTLCLAVLAVCGIGTSWKQVTAYRLGLMVIGFAVWGVVA